jgi:predicted nucleic acid-binding protein
VILSDAATSRPDAYLASLALTHRCRLATADRGFARFPGLDWFDPAAV